MYNFKTALLPFSTAFYALCLYLWTFKSYSVYFVHTMDIVYYGGQQKDKSPCKKHFQMLSNSMKKINIGTKAHNTFSWHIQFGFLSPSSKFPVLSAPTNYLCWILVWSLTITRYVWWLNQTPFTLYTLLRCILIFIAVNI